MSVSPIKKVVASLLQYQRPVALRVGITSRCQLRCPECSTASGENRAGTIGLGDMRSGEFSALLDSAPFIRSVEIAHVGEILLNKDLPQILKVSSERGVNITASVGVNLNGMTPEALDAMVRFKLKAMTVAIDGADQKVYERYRRGGDFRKVIANIKRINACKKKYKSPYPKLTWQFVVFSHNVHQLAKACSMADSLGMDFIEKLDWTEEPLAAGLSGASPAMPTRKDFLDRTGKVYVLPCRQAWLSPQINWNGDLLGCCDNKSISLGNVHRKGLDACLRSDRYIRFKRVVLGLEKAGAKDPCAECVFYKNELYRDRMRTLLKDLMSAGVLGKGMA